MDENVLLNFLKKNVRFTDVKKVYIIAKDEIDSLQLENLPIAVVLHSEVKAVKNGHWLALFIHEYKNEVIADYFDSLGRYPSDYGFLFPFPIKVCVKRPLQCSRAISCGLFVLYFISHRSRKISVDSIMLSFSKICNYNEDKVVEFYNRFK